jgi:flagellin-like protein
MGNKKSDRVNDLLVSLPFVIAFMLGAIAGSVPGSSLGIKPIYFLLLASGIWVFYHIVSWAYWLKIAGEKFNQAHLAQDKERLAREKQRAELIADQEANSPVVTILVLVAITIVVAVWVYVILYNL